MPSASRRMRLDGGTDLIRDHVHEQEGNKMSKAKPVIYLAGPITGHTIFQATNWRKDAKSFLKDDFNVIDPTDGLSIATSQAKGWVYDANKFGVSSRYDDKIPAFQANFYVNRAINDIKRCDGLLINLLPEVHGIGTWIEIGIATELAKPIFLVRSDPGNLATAHTVWSPFLEPLIISWAESVELACWSICDYYR